MRFVRAGIGLALLLLAACGQTSTPSVERASLASCNAMSDCTQPMSGGCFTVPCSGHVCTPTGGSCGGGCVTNANCDDANPCTTDTCGLAGACVNTPVVGAGCCVTVIDCAAANACQAASCTQSSCTYVSNGGGGCCNVTADCSGAATCVANTCTCAGGGRYCPGQGCVVAGGCCADTDCDSTHSNGRVCTAAGNCTYSGCVPGFGDCTATAPDLNGCETDLSSSTANCGACGQACGLQHNSARMCSASKCSYTCIGTFGDCVQTGANTDGCETNLASSAANCGACARACSANGVMGAPTCSGGLCTSSCTAGLGNCTEPAAPNPDDGCETDLTGDINNCGGCGRACSSVNTAARTCGAGLCTSSCVSGFGNCSRPAFPTADNGCEANLATDAANCGACAMACAGPTNACQTTSCASMACGYVSSGGPGCCNTVAQCSPNVCQNASCTANQCVYTGKVGVAGCCNTPPQCPVQTDPCKVNTCINNQCGTITNPCNDLGAGDLAVVDLKPPADLEPADAGSDLSTPADLAVSVDAGPDLSGLSLSGGGGCAFGGDGAGPGALLLVVLLIAMRRRRA